MAKILLIKKMRCLLSILIFMTATSCHLGTTSNRIPWLIANPNPTPTTTPWKFSKQVNSINKNKAHPTYKKSRTKNDKTHFDQAFNKLKSGEYKISIIEFQSLISIYPNSHFIDDSYYWIAEATYLLGQHKTAIERYTYFLEHYKNSINNSNAELKRGYAYYQLKYWPDAKVAFHDVISKYPHSTATRLARKRLKEMKSEGL